VFGTAADASLTGTFEQQIRATFNFKRQAFSAAVARRLSRTLSLSGNYQIQRVELFDTNIAPEDVLLIDRLFPQVRLSSFSFSAIHDNHDALNPRDGHYLSANAQIAARDIGSEVGFVKSYMSAQLFRLLPRTHATVLGVSARLGMAAGFPQGGQLAGEPDLPASERFFAGGDTTVRGFALDQLGSPATISGGFPVGGDAVVILNAELRVPVYRAFGVVGFFDTGNVFARTTDINLGQLRSSVGFGVRYRSPVGPIRVDLGFKVHREEIAPGVLESPTALHISLGQAF
jgi:outer membrane protein assembly factor BamA